jgi:hypothetical protein
MHLTPPNCPNCSCELTWRGVDRQFACPKCAVRLRTNYLGLTLFITGVVPLPFMLFFATDTFWVAALGAILLCIVSISLFKSLFRVRVVERDAS